LSQIAREQGLKNHKNIGKLLQGMMADGNTQLTPVYYRVFPVTPCFQQASKPAVFCLA
jgi:hypothetical protein